MVERAERHRQRPAGARPRHGGQRPGPAPRRSCRSSAPVILSSLTEVEERSLALEVRAFGRPGKRHLLWRMPDTPDRSSPSGRSLLLLLCPRDRGAPDRHPPVDRSERSMLQLTRSLVPLRRLRERGPPRHRPAARRRRDRRAGRAERGGQVDALPGRVRARAGVDRRRRCRGELTIDGQPTAGLSTHQLAERVGGRLPEPEHPALGDRRRRSSRRSRSGR